MFVTLLDALPAWLKCAVLAAAQLFLYLCSLDKKNGPANFRIVIAQFSLSWASLGMGHLRLFQHCWCRFLLGTPSDGSTIYLLRLQLLHVTVLQLVDFNTS